MNFNVKYILPSSIRGVLKKLIWAYTDYVSFKSYSGEGEDMILTKIFYKEKKDLFRYWSISSQKIIKYL